jgi:GTP-binding protein
VTIGEARFVKSSSSYQQCPDADLPEYAFIGRSNVGKSSLINMLTGRKSLAKISGTPGKTQLINHFLINDSWYLVDLPGYGYAKRSKKLKSGWEKMIHNYLEKRPNLVSTFILIDSRHEPLKPDLEFIEWFGQRELPFVLVFTKSDKLSKNKREHNLKKYSETLLTMWEELPVSVITSSVNKSGRENLLDTIQQMNEHFVKSIK